MNTEQEQEMDFGPVITVGCFAGMILLMLVAWGLGYLA